jgi:hypothetical protein
MKDTTPENVDLSVQTGEGKAKLIIKSTGKGFTITIEHPKNGTRTMTLNAIPVGPKNYYPTWYRLLEGLMICDKATSYGKLDKDRFGSTLTGVGSDDDEDTPF